MKFELNSINTTGKKFKEKTEWRIPKKDEYFIDVRINRIIQAHDNFEQQNQFVLTIDE